MDFIRGYKMESGKMKLLRQMMADGITYIFGNPGTVEQGILDELYQYPQLHYITCLQESVAVAMADGYARATGLPAVIHLHSGVGLGNGIGMLYQAYRGHTPLIVIAGEAGIQYDAMDAQMACDLVEIAKPVTKYAARVVHPASLLRQWRRAFKMAVTPPMGPVFLSLPLDILDMENPEEVRIAYRINYRCAPEDETIIAVVQALVQAVHPIILAGDGVSVSGATKALERCAELTGSPVYGVNTSCINISQSSTYYQGDLGHMFGENSKMAVQDEDVVLIVGTYTFPQVFPCLEMPFRTDASIFHIDLDSYEIAKNHPVTLGICADPRLTLEKINSLLEKASIPCRKNNKKEISSKENLLRQSNATVAVFMRELSSLLDENTIIFDESLTASGYVSSFLSRTLEGTFFRQEVLL